MSEFNYDDFAKEQQEIQSRLCVSKEDVWGSYEGENKHRGMIVARRGEICPIWFDVLHPKDVTIVCTIEQENDVMYWLEWVQGLDNIVARKEIGEGKVALRSEYMCW